MRNWWRFVPCFVTLIVGMAQVAQAIEPIKEYQERRQAYLERVKSGVSVIFNASDEELSVFRVAKDFFYLTGFSEPGAILVLSPQNPTHKETLFLRPRDPTQEKWTGPKADVTSEMAKRLGVERVVSRERFQSELTKLMEGEGKLYTILPPGRKEEWPSSETNTVTRIRQLFPFSEVLDASPHIAHLRMKKSASELELLRRAIAITLEGQKAAAGEISPDRFEYQVQAVLEYEFRRLGSSSPAFPSIVGSGLNSTILHYESNSKKMVDGELVVVDVGAEFGEYAADITRTYPVSGKFSPHQREIYSIVLEAQEAALKEVRPGANISRGGAIHKAAFEYINTHGKDLKGQSLGQYFIHGTSHHLGLDVHDAVDENSRPLEQGMVITVEPGIYLSEENLGVRIEDDVLVTESGYELLSRDLPRRPDEVEKFMAESSAHHNCH
ncbi:MAG TPA: aminopeptidase P N-terminal domain-containing protein [Desulfomonilaceae bacterium]|nr:aminopeptidase P N-terminal domain-containing protein [Desulfomonilaceae bacterium]